MNASIYLCLFVPLSVVTEVIAVLRVHGPTSADVCKAGLHAIYSLAFDTATSAALVDAGACTGAFRRCNVALSLLFR